MDRDATQTGSNRRPFARERRFARILASGFLLTALGVFGSQNALAQSATCLRLVNELAAFDSGGGFASPSPRYAQYAQAVRDQKAQIAKTERAALQNGCGNGGFFRSNAALCRRIDSSLRQMNNNLRDLQNNLSRLAPHSAGSSARRRAILNEMAAYGCKSRSNDGYAVRREPPRRRTLLEQIFGVRTYREDGSRAGSQYDPNQDLASRYGTYRTLCVRSCDGYYFPISFSTVPDRFEQDAQTCQSMCPGSDVSLYFHAMPSQDSEDMISYRTDQPYADLPTAFSYRKKFDPECSCKFASAGMTEIAGSGGANYGQESSEPAKPRIPLPTFKSDPGLDPDALANANGGFTRKDLAMLARRGEAKVSSILPDGAAGEPPQRKIRVVGPSFFPVQ